MEISLGFSWCFPPRSIRGWSFFLLGEKGSIKNKEIWNDTTKSKLWLYHIHYLHDLNAKNSDSRLYSNQVLIDHWLRNNPPLDGVAWEPYPLSLRIVNLVKWFSKHSETVTDEYLISLELQAQASRQQIEYHILGNHLFVNAKALVFVGAYLEGDKAENWLNKGLEILDREINEQFLMDGGILNYLLCTMQIYYGIFAI